jgi:hypothetical protein
MYRSLIECASLTQIWNKLEDKNGPLFRIAQYLYRTPVPGGGECTEKTIEKFRELRVLPG